MISLVKYLRSLSALLRAMDVARIITRFISSGESVIHVKCIRVSRGKGDRALTGFSSFVSTAR